MAAPQAPLLEPRGYSPQQAQVPLVVLVVLVAVPLVVLVVLVAVLVVVLEVPQQPTLMALPCLRARRLPPQLLVALREEAGALVGAPTLMPLARLLARLLGLQPPPELVQEPEHLPKPRSSPSTQLPPRPPSESPTVLPFLWWARLSSRPWGA